MPSDGRALENLVRTVEEFFLPKECKVEARKLVYGDDGAQLAELDILITGRLGTTEIRWLIECRDRPSEGSAPVAWIEQLGGRKLAHGFNQVTAVSTTGFSAGASEMAAKLGIETRTVSDASPSDVATWFKVEVVEVRNTAGGLEAVTIFTVTNETPEKRAALQARLDIMTGRSNEEILRATKTNALTSLQNALGIALNTRPDIGDDVVPNDPGGKRISLRVEYTNDDDHFVVDTELGPVRVKTIEFKGHIRVLSKQVPLEALKSYKRDATGAVISQAAIFPVEVEGRDPLSMELHNVAETGETYVVIRKR